MWSTVPPAGCGRCPTQPQLRVTDAAGHAETGAAETGAAETGAAETAAAGPAETAVEGAVPLTRRRCDLTRPRRVPHLYRQRRPSEVAGAQACARARVV